MTHSVLAARREPCPTLLPYTTLFRSDARDALRRAVRAGDAAARSPSDTRLWPLRRGCARSKAYGTGRIPAQLELDRKSTRLNSSHPSISYAVFCLKKKKTEADAYVGT